MYILPYIIIHNLKGLIFKMHQQRLKSQIGYIQHKAQYQASTNVNIVMVKNMV